MNRWMPLLALALCPLAAPASDVTLMPVNVRLDRNNDRATVQVVNNGTEPVMMRAEGGEALAALTQKGSTAIAAAKVQVQTDEGVRMTALKEQASLARDPP